MKQNNLFTPEQKLYQERRAQSCELVHYINSRCHISKNDMICAHSMHYGATHCEFVLPAQYDLKFEAVEKVFLELNCKVIYLDGELKATIPYSVLQTAVETLVQQDEMRMFQSGT